MDRTRERGRFFSYVDLEARVRKDHPLRTIRLIVNETLAAMERDFATLYSGTGRPSIAPEKLIAEDTGLIQELSDQLLRYSCLAARSWPNHVILAFNISPVQLKDRTLGFASAEYSWRNGPATRPPRD